MRNASAESLVNVGGPETAGIITIRRSVLVAAGVTAVFLGFLAAWLIHSNAPTGAAAAPLPARAADVSTIDEKGARGSDALVMPTTRPAPNPTLDPQMIADNGVVPMTQPTAAVPAEQRPSAAEQSAIARQQAADEAARARRQAVEDARDSGLAVKLDDAGTTQRTSAGDANVAAAGADSGPVGKYVEASQTRRAPPPLPSSSRCCSVRRRRSRRTPCRVAHSRPGPSQARIGRSSSREDTRGERGTATMRSGDATV
jgi:hypothetical protein